MSPLGRAVQLAFGAWAGALAIAAAYLVGCGTGHPRATGSDSWKPELANGAAGSGVRSGPCSDEGQVVDCHLETGQHDGIVDCFSGTQTCTNGAWTACGAAGGGSVSSHAFRPSLSSGNVTPQRIVVLDASARSAGCANNPCDPSCLGADVDAGSLQPDGGFSSTIVATTTSFSLLPGPKTGANPSGYCSTSVTSTSQCSYDMCCDPTGVGGGNGRCTAWPNETGCNACDGQDYTLAVGCQDIATGDTRVAVCNRGQRDSPTTGTLSIAIISGNPPTAGTSAICAVNGSGTQGSCTIDLARQRLKSGTCINLDLLQPAAGITCTGNVTSGNRYLMVNDQHTQAECNVCNNFSFDYTQQAGCAPYGAQPPPPAAVSNQYVGTCPPGTRLRWNQFAYNTSVPDSSGVTFTVSTAPLVDGGVGATTSPVVAANPATPAVTSDPAYCPMSGSDAGTCPKDLYALLGATAAANPVLQLDVGLVATTAVPTVYGWQMTYDCIPTE